MMKNLQSVCKHQLMGRFHIFLELLNSYNHFFYQLIRARSIECFNYRAAFSQHIFSDCGVTTEDVVFGNVGERVAAVLEDVLGDFVGED